MDPVTPLRDADATRRLRWRVERVRDPDHPLYKPRLRGWIHAVMAPLTLAAGIVLIVLAPTATLRWASAVYAVTGLLLFAVSATYHLVQWNEVVSRVLKRLDHTNIMLVIAGTYTPLSLALLPPDRARVLLTLVWVGAVAGVAFRVLWTDAPRWLYTPVYVALGLAALLYLGDFFAADAAAGWLIVAGGVAYITGAVFYALQAPTIHREWFGFHELFHAFTVAGFVCHAVAIYRAVLVVA
ncbi:MULTISPECIES: PAQR family membrane homeostasis protein TrhA [unclassified Micrococcus]|uniref:PAQR family membrane homeostasis protein TrhA n=1 Tax=unclassified Micrococcus TaxID=2620948 RepID=UPI000F44E457|nr:MULTISPECIES: hemolysin III family protein [unclassified Micrococcus]RNM10538.1 hemolysin III family protein [Micrococcus sp. RIT608]VWX45268.1 Hemolysin III family protein [Micrococcus sp. 116]